MQPIAEGVFLVFAAIVAAIMGSIVGARRGIKAAEDRSDQETQKLVKALTDRVSLLERANAEKDATIATQNTIIATLTTRVSSLEADLHKSDAAVRRLVADKHVDGR